MKLLLTSGGLMNQGMTDALEDLLGQPFKKSKVVYIPTAANAERGDKWWLVKDYSRLYKLGWKQMEIIDLAACASLPRALWWGALEEADAFVVGGGNSFYLSYWMQQSGFMEALPALLKTKVYVGISAGSVVMGASLAVSSQCLDTFGVVVHKDDEYNEMGPPGQSSAKTLGAIRAVIRPHLNSRYFPKIRPEILERMAAQLDVPMYAIDDQTALKVTGSEVEVISEGQWKLYP